ncbi:MAG: ABC transporter permease [Actinobacteria bacterium]|nr:ABC transporter permease [Actinomycetota bacterium]
MSELVLTRADYDQRQAPGRGDDDPRLKPLDYSVLPRRSELARFFELSLGFARNELKQRYFASAGGYLWTLIRPVLVFGTLYVVFTHIVRLGGDIENYPAYLLMSLTLWTYFADTTVGGVTSLVDRSDVVRKIHFPLAVIPMALLMTTALHMVLNLLVVGVLIVALGVTPTLSWLAALPLILVWVIFANGVSMFLSVAYVRFRDMQQIWEVGSQVLFWATPIIYVATFPDSPIREILFCNPLSPILSELRHLIVDPAAPTATEVVGNDLLLLVPAAIIVGVVALGFWSFVRQARSVAEHM